MRDWTVLYSPGAGMGDGFVALALILWNLECLTCGCGDLLRYNLLSWLFYWPAHDIGVVGVLRQWRFDHTQFSPLECKGLDICATMECFANLPGDVLTDLPELSLG